MSHEVIVLAGDFKTKREPTRARFVRGQFCFIDPESLKGWWSRGKYVCYAMSDVVELRQAYIDEKGNVLGSLGFGALGALALGAVGFVIGSVVGGMKRWVLFEVKFSDGKCALAKIDPVGWDDIVRADTLLELEDRWGLPDGHDPGSLL